MLRLLQCRELVGGTYGHVGFKAYGSWGRRMVQISIIMMQAGFCCTYVIFVAQNMAEVLAFWGHTVDTSMLILLQIAVNLIADVFILYGLAFILGNSFWLLATDGPAKDVELFNQQDYPVFIGTSIFTFEGIGLVLPTQSSLNQSRQKRFPRLLSWTVVGLLVFYSFFAGINYITFGSSIAPMVTSSLPRNGWSSSVQFGYSFAQLLSYPLFLFPAVKIMEEMLGFPRRASGQKVAKNCFRAVAVLATVCIAYFGQGRLDLFVSIVGAFCCGNAPEFGVPSAVPSEAESERVVDGQDRRHVRDHGGLAHVLLRDVLEPPILEQVGCLRVEAKCAATLST
ncbi:hypothetical protein ON010_g12006 [Phytophthora cinnamomi]|nr:hypothetical protein ON010_g12006 [Phytophthora cinnamomi]